MSNLTSVKDGATKWLLAAALTSFGASLSADPADMDQAGKAFTRPAGRNPALSVELPGERPAQTRGAPSRIMIKKISIQGLDLLTPEEKDATTGRFEGREASLDELDRLCARITQLTRTKGHFLARAYLPQQEVKDGAVTIVVLEARLESTKVVNASLVDDETIRMRLKVVPEGTPATEHSLGMALAAVTDLPGVQIIKAAVSPGIQTGGTVLTITTTPTSRIRGLAYIDNHGASYTGNNRFGASLLYASPTGTGDEIGLSFIQSLGSGLTSGLIRYEKPTSTNTSSHLSVSHSNYSLGGNYAALKAHGNSDSLEAGLTLDLWKTSALKLSSTLALGLRKLNDQVDSIASMNPKKDTYGSASVDFGPAVGSQDGRKGFSGSLRVVAGKISFLDANSSALDAANAKTQGEYKLAEAELGYSFDLSTTSTLSIIGRAQHSFNSKNLDGSRRFGATGPDALRAYSSSELLGDNGSLIRAEYLYSLDTAPGFDTTLTLFLEHGHVSGGNNGSDVTSRSLHDYGVNVKIGFSNWSVDASAAFAGNDNTLSEQPKNVRFLLKVSRQF